MVRSLKEHDPLIEAIVADAEEPPFRSNCFDLVACSRMIKMTDYHALIKSARRIIKNSGRMRIVFDSGDVFWVRISERLGKPIDADITGQRALLYTVPHS
jgi:ubiquinone/menaquinone biosynthesis C-methylase UbiE